MQGKTEIPLLRDDDHSGSLLSHTPPHNMYITQTLSHRLLRMHRTKSETPSAMKSPTKENGIQAVCETSLQILGSCEEAGDFLHGWTGGVHSQFRHPRVSARRKRGVPQFGNGRSDGRARGGEYGTALPFSLTFSRRVPRRSSASPSIRPENKSSLRAEISCSASGISSRK